MSLGIVNNDKGDVNDNFDTNDGNGCKEIEEIKNFTKKCDIMGFKILKDFILFNMLE